MPCTNNRVEGCNRQFEGDCTTAHPVFWTFLDILKREKTSTK